MHILYKTACLVVTDKQREAPPASPEDDSLLYAANATYGALQCPQQSRPLKDVDDLIKPNWPIQSHVHKFMEVGFKTQ